MTESPVKPSAAELATAVQVADREQAKGRFENALAIYKTVLAQIPAYLDGRAKMARALFCLRRWDEAWDAFDIRFRLMDVPPQVNARNRDGSPRILPRTARGPVPKYLLVMSEQGMGDTIQFARFLPRLLEKGVDVQVVVPQKLFGLLRTLDPSPPLLAGEVPSSVNNVDNWTTMMDLPRLLGLKEEDYLAREPYLRADPARVARWRLWLDEVVADRKGPVIAFAWRGNPQHKLDPKRSAQLEDFAPLAAIDGVTLVCLQINATNEEIAACSFKDKIVRPDPTFDSGLDAFLDSAALLQSVDRLVCVDTSLVHLAGALHCPVDMMITWSWPDWRWLDIDHENVWYPTLKIWRQAPGEDNYGALMARLAQSIVTP
jgi:hypothetical protein